MNNSIRLLKDLFNLSDFMMPSYCRGRCNFIFVKDTTRDLVAIEIYRLKEVRSDRLIVVSLDKLDELCFNKDAEIVNEEIRLVLI